MNIETLKTEFDNRWVQGQKWHSIFLAQNTFVEISAFYSSATHNVNWGDGYSVSIEICKDNKNGYKNYGYLTKSVASGAGIGDKKGFVYKSPTPDRAKIATFWEIGLFEVDILDLDLKTGKSLIRPRLMIPISENLGKSQVRNDLLPKIEKIHKVISIDNFLSIKEVFLNSPSLEVLLDQILFYLHGKLELPADKFNEYKDSSDYNVRLHILTDIIDNVSAGDRLQKIVKRTVSSASLSSNTSINEKGDIIAKISALKAISVEDKKRLLNIANALSARETSSYSNDIQYLNTIIGFPWEKVDSYNVDLSSIRKELDIVQFGLKKPKDSILEYLAIKTRKEAKIKAPILCLVGPSGVGKTFFAKNVAKVLGLKYTSIAMGGIQDVVMIRGRQRGWIGAEPGLISKALIQTETMNPVVILDEIDKVGNTPHGQEVLSALLEALDPNQNYEFRDHYLDIPIDLSHVFFITTANYIGDIPMALRDRLEIIEIRGYTDSEKRNIVENFVLKSLKENYAISDFSVQINDNVWDKLLDRFRYEPGIRGLYRSFETLLRRVLLKELVLKGSSLVIDEHNYKEFLDFKEYKEDSFDPEQLSVGVARGMSVSESGIGKIATVEVNVYKGRGNLQITGLVEKMMEESIKLAVSYIRARSEQLGVDSEFSQNMDISFHFPSASIKKDGPSAGGIITIALISALVNKAIRQNIAMTGEIDLSGNVRAIGGVVEKITGTYRYGIKEFIVPESNRNELDEITPEIRDNIVVHFVKHLDEVLPLYFPEFTI